MCDPVGSHAVGHGEKPFLKPIDQQRRLAAHIDPRKHNDHINRTLIYNSSYILLPRDTSQTQGEICATPIYIVRLISIVNGGLPD